jgi:N,N'-diacetyllegionaminate synthase
VRTKIIAEIGWNHMGDMDLAKKMIVAAKESGADYAKFQTWSVKNLKPGPWDNDGRLEIYKKAEISKDKHSLLKQYCDKIGINFLTSIFNVEDIDWLSELNCKIIKVPSHEVYNSKLIEKLDGKFETILISTGASKWNEVVNIKALLSKSNFTLMHCVSAYPCNSKNINLERINDLKTISKEVGYSGHSPEIYDAIASMNYEVSFIEKHFTIDKSLPGRDNEFALLPSELKTICDYRDRFFDMNIYHGKNSQDIESDVIDNYRGRWSKG